ncbi:MAG TPA: tetratricopeptide repeat protein [Terriglobales bacterium]|nr:tetratricopeptide repeat protein [Terriglobales bacterium]
MHLRRSALVAVVLCSTAFAASNHSEAARHARAKLLPITTASPAARKLFLQAMVNMENLRTEWALAGWRAATKRDPNFAQAQILVAYLTQDPVEERTALARAKKLAPKATPGERLLIEWLSGVREGRYVPAIAAMNDLLSMYPRDRRIAFLAGRWMIQQRRYDHGEMLLEQAITLYPNYPAAVNELGYAYAFNGEFKKAMGMMEKYVSLQPAEPNPQDSYAEILRLSGDFNGALQHYRQALELDPNFVSSQLGIADTYALMGNEDQARHEYEKAIAVADGEGERLQYGMQEAATYVRERRYVQADQAFRALAAEAHSEGFARVEADAYRSMAIYQPQMADAMKSLDQAEKALQDHEVSQSDREEEQALILGVRTRRAVQANDRKAALQSLQQLQALAASSRSEVVQRSYHAAAGALAVAQGKYTQAVAHLEEDQSNPLSLELLWRALEKTGAREEAAALHADVAALNEPTLEQALVNPQLRASLSGVAAHP